MSDDVRARIQHLLVTGDNRLKQGVAPDKVRESYEQALALAREAGLEDSVRPLVEIRLADLEERHPKPRAPVPSGPPPCHASLRIVPHHGGSLRVKQWQRYLGELLGTFVLVPAARLQSSRPRRSLSAGPYAPVGGAPNSGLNAIELIVPFGFGLALLAGLYMFAEVSGGHFNPAVSLSLFLDRRLTFEDLLGYWIFQFSGAILASLLMLIPFNHDLVKRRRPCRTPTGKRCSWRSPSPRSSFSSSCNRRRARDSRARRSSRFRSR